MVGTTFTLGADASCTDGLCGAVQRIVVDPAAGMVTHLAIEPKHRTGLGRLVPVELVEPTAGPIRLRCSRREFAALERSEERHVLPGSDAAGADPWLRRPAFGFGAGIGLGMDMALGTEHYSDVVIVDRIPDGEVALRSDLAVHATDGDIGRVRGVAVDQEWRVTHVLLRARHLLHHTDIAVPIGLITSVGDGIRLSIAKHDVVHLQTLASAN